MHSFPLISRSHVDFLRRKNTELQATPQDPAEKGPAAEAQPPDIRRPPKEGTWRD